MNPEIDQPVHQLPANEIAIKENRIRKTFNRKKAENFVESIRICGQIQPGVCRRNEEGKVELVVGERRLRACASLDIPFTFILKEETINPWLLRRIELEENIMREDLPWLDEVAAKEELHILFQKEFGETKSGQRGGHGYGETAEYLGESRSMLHEDVQLSVWARSVPEVASAKTKTEAKKIVERLEKTLDRQDRLDEAIAERISEADEVTEDESVEKEDLTEFDRRLLEFDKRCLLGSMEEKILEFAEESVDIVFFDPPWGVSFDKTKKESAGVQDFEDDPESWDANIENWLTLIYGRMAKDSHLYMFFPIIRATEVYSLMEKIGLETHGIPIIWHKKGAHHVRTPKKWPGRSYEPIVFARKGNKDLVEQGRPDVIITPAPTPSIKDIHPSAKHPEVYRELIQRSASPGDTLLDPMAGSGMLGVAAESLRDKYALDWRHIEIDKDYRNLQIFNLNRGYWDITGARGGGDGLGKQHDHLLTESTTTKSFKTLVPGSDAWSQHWKLHPEEQEEMLAYSKSLKDER